MRVLWVWSGSRDWRRSWEWLTAEELRRAGCEVEMVSEHEPVARPDAVFSTEKHELAAEYAREFKVPYACWLVAGWPKDYSEERARAVAGADLLLAVSETAKRDFLATFPLGLSGEIRICYHGANERAAKKARSSPRGWLCWVGHPEDGRKRFELFAEVCSLSLSQALVISPHQFDAERVARLGVSGQYMVGAPEERKFEALKSSLALLCTSSWETFFIPACEAAACGTPLVSYDLPVIREVWGDSVLYFESTDEAVLHVWELQEDEKLRRRVARAMRRVYREKGLSLRACALRIKRHLEGLL